MGATRGPVSRFVFTRGKRLLQRLGAGERSAAPRQVVFLTGCHRSGTNMILQVLEHSMRTEVFREGDPRAFKKFMLHGPEVLQRLIENSPAACVVIKALHEVELMPDYLERFEGARVIWVYRHYTDVINSHLKRWPNYRGHIEELIADPKSVHWRGRGISDAAYDQVKQLHRPDINDQSALALFWLYRNRFIYDTGLDRDPRVAVIGYEAVAGNPSAGLSPLVEFLDLTLTPAMTRAIHAKSVRRHHAPDLDPAIEEECEKMWARLGRDDILAPTDCDAPITNAMPTRDKVTA